MASEEVPAKAEEGESRGARRSFGRIARDDPPHATNPSRALPLLWPEGLVPSVDACVRWSSRLRGDGHH